MEVETGDVGNRLTAEQLHTHRVLDRLAYMHLGKEFAGKILQTPISLNLAQPLL
jgi:hypothetical protein